MQSTDDPTDSIELTILQTVYAYLRAAGPATEREVAEAVKASQRTVLTALTLLLQVGILELEGPRYRPAGM